MHPPHRTKHLATAISAPHNRQTTEYIPSRRIHRHDHTHKTRQHKRQQTIPQHARASRKRQSGAQLAPAAHCLQVIGAACTVRTAGRWIRVAGIGGGVRAGGGRHEGEDCVEGEGADEGEAVDVAEVDLAGEEEEGAEEEEEEDGAREVGVVHYVGGDWREGGEYC